MLKHPIFSEAIFDLSTVGERGQVVIPAAVRKQMELKAGDKVLVMSGLKGMSAILINARFLSKVLKKMEGSINQIKKRIK
ncbi:hypothetical protein A2311_01010 [candidate division WOR-1 bacterium RIFOXYB2_FULL_48_7]|uniref:SpoVT-AbrB domain-containing protein n=1 Tax=candidate division WOR-1 bacterium RIFOXYB2_FULL_48_7 TaxID=1802583 RepID=A0A1F4TKT0_UNCSA|nr:MAG: hypothetical protein A2311_01010 [candidate division WOR-1 bacterium RIFOXYB2_FULL_48_7]